MEKVLLALGVAALLGATVYMLNQEAPVAEVSNGVEPQVYDLYQDWKKKYNKKFATPDQDWYRLTVFNDNYNYIKDFYQSAEERTYTLEFNQFMDITNQEFVQTYLGTTVPEQRTQNLYVASEPAPNAIDWRDRGATNPVRNQGGCGSCWAFSAVAAMEGAYVVAGKGLPQMSEQELVDCSRSYGNYGCGGGWMDNAFHYVRDNGISTQSAYPYAGRDQSCARKDGTYRISSSTNVGAGDCAGLESLASQRPVSVAVDASNWQFYGGGVFNNCAANLNHGVTLVAYDESKWVIRNSWSSGWGEAGHISLAKGNTCGVCNAASAPVA